MISLQVAMSIGSNAPNVAANSRQPYHSSVTVPLFTQTPSVVSFPGPAQQMSPLALSSSSTQAALHDTPDPINSSNQIASLLKPSFFVPPSSSSSLTTQPITSSGPAVALNPPINLQRPYGTPLLQPFPPPTPPPSLTPSATPNPIDRPVITREKIRDALVMLVQVYFHLL